MVWICALGKSFLYWLEKYNHFIVQAEQDSAALWFGGIDLHTLELERMMNPNRLGWDDLTQCALYPSGAQLLSVPMLELTSYRSFFKRFYELLFEWDIKAIVGNDSPSPFPVRYLESPVQGAGVFKSWWSTPPVRVYRVSSDDIRRLDDYLRDLACSLEASPARAGRSQETPNKDREGELPKPPGNGQATPHRPPLLHDGNGRASEALAEMVTSPHSENGVTATEAARNGSTPEAVVELPDLVTLDQAAALVNRSARTLERYKKRGLPRPFVLGGGGKPHEYPLDEMRKWLQKTFNRPIPEAAIQRYRHPKNS